MSAMSYRDFMDRSWFGGRRQERGQEQERLQHRRRSRSRPKLRSSSVDRRYRRKSYQNVNQNKDNSLFKWVAMLALVCLVTKMLFLPSSDVMMEEAEVEEEDCNLRMRRIVEEMRNKCANDPLTKHLVHSYYPEAIHFRSNDEHKAAVCTPHKCGSESWRYFFEKLDERDRNSSEWRSAIPEEIPQDFDEYIRAFQVRHPLERVLSSFRYVFEKTTLYMTDNLAIRILEKFAGFQVDPEIKGRIFPNRTVTFKEFAKFLAHQDLFDAKVTQKSASSHWRPQHLQCNPCHQDLKPDLLIHLENADDDTECFLDQVRGLQDQDYENLFVVNRHPDGSSALNYIKKKYYGTLSKSEVKGIAEFYKIDLLLYGYDIQEFLDLAKAPEEPIKIYADQEKP